MPDPASYRLGWSEMSDMGGRWNTWWAFAAIVACVSLLMTLEIIEEPHMTLPQILMELIEPLLLVLTGAGVVYLMLRSRLQHEEQLPVLLLSRA